MAGNYVKRALIVLVTYSYQMTITANLKIGCYHCSTKCWPIKSNKIFYGPRLRLYKGTIEFQPSLVKSHSHLSPDCRLGERINNPSSIYYWAAKNKIPVFSPALTDGSLGDMMYFHSHRHPGLVVDILSDLKRLNTMAVKAKNSGVIIVGGGLIKHHICNANLMVRTLISFNPKPYCSHSTILFSFDCNSEMALISRYF